MNSIKENTDFRDKLATIDEEGKRIWVHPKKPSGPFFRARAILGYILIAFLFAGPFIKLHGDPLLMLNFFERKFIIFGIYFWPQDFYVAFLMMISLVVFIILFTVTFGRLFCGWTCPQTIFMELIFRQIEYLIDGDHTNQKKLRQQKWNAEKIFKRVLKNAIFLIISAVIINTFISYIVGFEKLKETVLAGPQAHPIGFAVMLLFTILFFFVFSYFREQVCTIVCPYGRLQGVLLDSNSVIVAYDYKRGEPKGPYSSKTNRQETGLGDCVDCSNCILVCPTGIDIRNGTQLECINCTACIDACNSIMLKFGFAKGLIRYSSENRIAKGEKLKPTSRMIAYSAVLIVLLTFGLTMLISRPSVENTILRTPGIIYQENPDGTVSNLFNIKSLNKTRNEKSLEIKAISHQAKVVVVGNPLKLKSHGSAETVFFVYIDKKLLGHGSNKLVLGIFENGKLIEKERVTFTAP